MGASHSFLLYCNQLGIDNQQNVSALITQMTKLFHIGVQLQQELLAMKKQQQEQNLEKERRLEQRSAELEDAHRHEQERQRREKHVLVLRSKERARESRWQACCPYIPKRSCGHEIYIDQTVVMPSFSLYILILK